MSISANIIAEALVVGSTPCDAAIARLEMLLGDLAYEPMVRAAVALSKAVVLAMLERFGEARDRVAESSEVFEELSQVRWSAEAAYVTGLIDRWEGDDDAAERAMRTSHRSFEGRGEADAALVAADLALILCDLGRHAEAHALARSIIRDAPSFALEPQIGWRRVMAKIAAARGDRQEAAALAREAVRLVSSTDLLTLQSDALVDLADSLLPDRPRDALEAADGALDLCARKGSLAGARRARSMRERASAAQL